MTIEEPAGHAYAAAVRCAIREVAEDEAKYLLHGDRHDPVYLPWMPFQWADFTALLAECVAEAEGDIFCDIGAGPGTKMRLAKALFGLHAMGIERDELLAERALEMKSGLMVVADALTVPAEFWSGMDIIWMYRPFRDPDRERELERRVYAHMKPGAIFAGGALEAFPENWHIVVDDMDARRGAWKKP